MNTFQHSKIWVLFSTFIGWIFIYPLSWIIPKDKNSMVLIGNKNGSFLDNVKYFYLYLQEIDKNQNFVFITSDRQTFSFLSAQYDNILYYPSRKAYWKLFRCEVVVVDNSSWMNDCKFLFLRGAKVVQIWHGIGYKKIQRCNKKFISETSSFFRRTLLNYFGMLPHYQALVSTSTFFTEKVFKPAFISEHFINTGYPRNDVLLHPKKYEQVRLNTDQETIKKVEEYKKRDAKCIVYAPTFRDTGGDAISDKAIDLKKLNDFAQKENLVFVFKLHPLPVYKSTTDNFDRILWYNNTMDVYPFLHLADAMISDYSSIYLDYILLDRPVLLFLYDKEKYETVDRELHPFYADFFIGPVSKNQNQLENDLIQSLSKEDSYSSLRKQILEKSYEHIDDNSAERIFNFIQDNYLRN